MPETFCKDPRRELRDWLAESRAGIVLQGLEADYLRNAVCPGYGKNLVQLGVNGWEERYLDGECGCTWIIEPHRAVSAPAGAGRILAEFTHLPLATESVDDLVLVHVLEFERDRHQVLREAERVLKPEGRLHILGFNPLNLRGWWRPSGGGRLRWGCISPGRVLDWLSLLEFTAEWKAGLSVVLERVSYPCRSLAEHFVAAFSAVYAIRAIKRTYRYIPLGSRAVAQPRILPQGAVGTSSRTSHAASVAMGGRCTDVSGDRARPEDQA
jgi:SAM-dependent methyltransferase